MMKFLLTVLALIFVNYINCQVHVIQSQIIIEHTEYKTGGNDSYFFKNVAVTSLIQCSDYCANISGCHGFTYRNMTPNYLCQLLNTSAAAVKNTTELPNYIELKGCKKDRCQNGGECVLNIWLEKRFVCICPPDYSGNCCEHYLPRSTTRVNLPKSTTLRSFTTATPPTTTGVSTASDMRGIPITPYACENSFKQPSGSGAFGSDKYPQNYVNNLDCYYHITTPPGTKVTLHVKSLYLESMQNCIYDYLKIYDGPNTTYPVVGKICSMSDIRNYHLSSNQALVYFHTDNSVTDRGFQIEYNNVPR